MKRIFILLLLIISFIKLLEIVFYGFSIENATYVIISLIIYYGENKKGD